jgi:hypothetical protein
MVGLPTGRSRRLGPQLKGFTTPTSGSLFRGCQCAASKSRLTKYQAGAASAGIDALDRIAPQADAH